MLVVVLLNFFKASSVSRLCRKPSVTRHRYTAPPPPPAPSESSLFNGANCSTVFITSAISGAFPKS